MVKPGSKYFPLYQALRKRGDPSFSLSFEEIEGMMERALPASARQGRSFWGNRGSQTPQSTAWTEAGYQVGSVDLSRGQVTFRSISREYRVEKEGGEVVWDGEMVRALRTFMDLSQSEMAERLGVRQQTISEWEGERYQPTRSRSKHLSLIAERAGFPLEEGEHQVEPTEIQY